MRARAIRLGLVVSIVCSSTMANAQPTAGYDDGFFIQSEDEQNKLKFGGSFDAQVEYDHQEKDTSLSPQAEFEFKGNVYTEDLKFKLKFRFRPDDVDVTDYYVNYELHPWLHGRIGRWRLPYARQQMTSSERLQFGDRSIADNDLGWGREIGVAFHNNYKKPHPFTYVVGAWHLARTDIDTLNPALVARLGLHNGKLKGYSESDLEGGKPRLGVGVAGLLDFDSDTHDDGHLSGTADFMLKAYGFSLQAAMYLAYQQETDTFEPEFNQLGTYVQGGYVIAGHVEPTARYAMRNSDAEFREEATFGLNTFIFGHDLKWQNDVSIFTIHQDDADLNEYRYLSSLQATF